MFFATFSSVNRHSYKMNCTQEFMLNVLSQKWERSFLSYKEKSIYIFHNKEGSHWCCLKNTSVMVSECDMNKNGKIASDSFSVSAYMFSISDTSQTLFPWVALTVQSEKGRPR
jgi:hypothetical protein